MIEDGIYPRYDPGMSHHRLFLDPPEFEFSRRWQHCGDPLGILATARPAAKFELGKLSHLGRGNNARDGGTEREREERRASLPQACQRRSSKLNSTKVQNSKGRFISHSVQC